MISMTHNREVAQEAMRDLLGIAERITETGSGNFSADKLASAKAYYEQWKENSIFMPTWWFFVAVIASFYFSCQWTLLAVMLLIFVKQMNESSTLKINYVREMVGDWRHIEQKKRKFFQHGLVAELWKEGEEKEHSNEVKNKLLFTLGVFALIPCGAVFLFHLHDPRIIIGAKILTLIFVTAIFFMNFKDEPK